MLGVAVPHTLKSPGPIWQNIAQQFAAFESLHSRDIESRESVTTCPWGTARWPS